MKYEVVPNTDSSIGSSFVVLVYQINDDSPNFIQKSYPNGDSFETEPEATEWAESFLDSLLNENSKQAIFGKGLDRLDKVPMPSPEELAAKEEKITKALEDAKAADINSLSSN